MLRPRWRKLCTELAHALRSHVIAQHDNEVESRWPCDAFVIHAGFVHDEIINLAVRRFAKNYIVDETDEEKERQLPKLPQATRLDQETIKVKIIFFGAAIGSKNYARQEYLSSGLGTADQPLMGFTVSFILQ